MPLKLTVGLSQKMGLPDYGSLGASCQLEVELDPSLALNNLPTLRHRIRQLHGICRQAVLDELAVRLASPPTDERPTDSATASAEEIAAGGTGAAAPLPRASQRQLDYALQLARQIPAVGVVGLPRLAQHLFQKVPPELTSLEASSLIDVLKELRVGKLSVQDTLPGAAA